MSNEYEDPVKAAVKDLIVGFGVLEGLWIYAGVNPFKEILNAFAPLLAGIGYSGYIWAANFILFFLIPLAQIILVHNWGGVLGLFALLLAFIGGIFIGSEIGILTIFLGIGLGFVSFSMNNKITLSDVIELLRDTIGFFRKIQVILFPGVPADYPNIQ